MSAIECTADAEHPCGKTNGTPCANCVANEAYWRRQWEAYGRREVANRYSREDILDAYSHPTEQAKRDSLLRDLESGLNAG